MTHARSLSVIVPAKNEVATVGALVERLRATLPGAEVLIVDDGSTDGTGEAAQAAGARVVRHPASRGNGAAIKTGARHAGGDLLLFMDADGQHGPEQVQALLAQIEAGYDMAVGARTSDMHASVFRRFANWVYNTLATWITGVKIADLTSGFRVARADVFRSFLPLLPNGFSYPTTITLAFLRAGYSVAYVPVQVHPRSVKGKSHIRIIRDGGRFLLIIFRVGTLYSPLKIFVPFSLLFFLLGAAWYGYTFATTGRFTNLGALLFTSSVFIFLIGLVSEQITQLMFHQSGSGR
jgi:glycosyltransferase involved in cell wall biosynthesis